MCYLHLNRLLRHSLTWGITLQDPIEVQTHYTPQKSHPVNTNTKARRVLITLKCLNNTSAYVGWLSTRNCFKTSTILTQKYNYIYNTFLIFIKNYTIKIIQFYNVNIVRTNQADRLFLYLHITGKKTETSVNNIKDPLATKG